jgi:xylulokinase
MPIRTGVVGVDLGTSAVKVVVVDLSGAVRGSGTRAYPLHRPGPGAAESDPADWWAAATGAVRTALSQATRHGRLEVAGLAVDGQMHGLVLADDQGRPVRPAMSWADSRATEQLPAWRALPEADRARLANPITAGMLGPQLAWVAEHEHVTFAGAAHALLPKDWLRLQLTGAVSGDPSDASATLLWDVPADTWAWDLLPALGVPPELLPVVRESAELAGALLAEVAAGLGLPPGIPVATGAGDTAAALLATGLEVGQTQLTVGSGAQVVQLRERPAEAGPGTSPVADPVADPVTHLYRAAEPQRWYAMAAVQNAGLALDWVRAVLGVNWEQLYAVLEAEPPAGDGHEPVFVPYLTGERTPVLDDGVRASWGGLDLAHGRDDLLRAAAIGVVCAIRHAVEALPGPGPEVIRVAGGGTTDPRLRQLLADVLAVAVLPLSQAGASAMGAARLAASAAGLSLPAHPAAMGDPVIPGPRSPARQAAYQRYLDTVRRLTW